MFTTALIIDKRKELPVKYKKAIESSQIHTEISRNLKDALFNIQHFEPDIIIVSDSIDENLCDFCEKIRTLTYNTRPVIIALSKSADTNDRISILEHGADDFLSEPVNTDEFKTRIMAHIRRDVESNLDSTTLLPNQKITYKMLRRMLNSEQKQSVLIVSVENFSDYKSIYSELAGNKVLQTFTAIAKSALDENDFIGQLNETEFVIILNPYGAEKFAEYITFAFDTITPKFYSQKDSQRGYMLLKNDMRAEMRVNFVSILIGGVLDNFEYINSVESLFERLYYMKKLAKVSNCSHYMIDRLRIGGENSIVKNNVNKSVYIDEQDEALYLLLRTTLELQGYDIKTSLDKENTDQPAIVIIDAKDDLSGLELCKTLKRNSNFVNTRFIITSTVQDKTTILNTGVDLYLPKPYELSDLVRWVEYFISKM